ncbi:MAG: hypothetical protein OXG80_09015 [Chloroflexi bacterium]|nr:hypothetical protein [Chloroflexota bacterium]
MDVTAAGIFIGLIAILLGIFGLMWQMNSQSTRLQEAIDTQGRELRAEMKEQGEELRAEMKEQGEEIKAQGARVSQAELEQARLNGVNSVLLRQAHTHENLDGSD